MVNPIIELSQGAAALANLCSLISDRYAEVAKIQQQLIDLDVVEADTNAKLLAAQQLAMDAVNEARKGSDLFKAKLAALVALEVKPT